MARSEHSDTPERSDADDDVQGWLRGAATGGTEQAPSDPDRGLRNDPAEGWIFVDDDSTVSPPSRFSRVLLVAATAPWVVVLGLVVLLVGGGQASEPGPDPPAPVPPTTPPESGAAVGPAPTFDAGTADPSGDAAAAAAAALGVRWALSGPLDAEAATYRHVDIAGTEYVERIGDVRIVSVLAIVLDGDAEQWTAARPARYGVAVHATLDGFRLAGAPWALPPPDPEPLEPPTETLEDPDRRAAATAALTDAGYIVGDDASVTALAGAPLLLAEVRGHQAQPEEEPQTVWLRATDPPVVLGLAPPAGRHPAADPFDDPSGSDPEEER